MLLCCSTAIVCYSICTRLLVHAKNYFFTFVFLLTTINVSLHMKRYQYHMSAIDYAKNSEKPWLSMFLWELGFCYFLVPESLLHDVIDKFCQLPGCNLLFWALVSEIYKVPYVGNLVSARHCCHCLAVSSRGRARRMWLGAVYYDNVHLITCNEVCVVDGVKKSFCKVFYRYEMYVLRNIVLL